MPFSSCQTMNCYKVFYKSFSGIEFSVFCILDFILSIRCDTISVSLSIVHLKGPHVEYLKYDIFLSLKVVLILATHQTLVKCSIMLHLI